MSHKGATWGVVATVREPISLIAAFVAHHLDLGAGAIGLFFDDPKDPAAEVMEAMPGVHVYRCDKDHWTHRIGQRRPKRQNFRQSLNANYFAAQTDMDWLLHADADEFLYAPDGVDAVLAKAADFDAIKFANVERIWHQGQAAQSIFDGPFRKAWRGDAAVIKTIYGDWADIPNAGLVAYSAGKIMVRTGLGLKLTIHSARYPGAPDHKPKVLRDCGAVILHYDGLTANHWIAKALRYADLPIEVLEGVLRPNRISLVMAIRDMGNDKTAAKAMHRFLYHVSPKQVAQMRRHDLFFEATIDPSVAAQNYFPKAAFSFTPDAFDRAYGLS